MGTDVVEKVLECLMSTNDETEWYYNSETKEFLIYSGFSDSETEDKDCETLIRLPSRYEIDEYGMMKEFADRVPECEQLLDAMSSRGAFRRFKDKVYDLDMEKEWFEYRDNKYREIAEEWCKKNGLLPADNI